jgi:hypothetical protein
VSLINTPEIGMKYYTEAKDLTLNLCPVGSMALVDQDGRMIGKVYCNFKAGVENLTYLTQLRISVKKCEEWIAEVLTKYCSGGDFAGELWTKKYDC